MPGNIPNNPNTTTINGPIGKPSLIEPKASMTKEALEHTINNLEIWLIIFACMVAIGVAGEFIFGWISWKRQTELKALQSKDEKEMLLKIEELRRDNLQLEADLSARTFQDQGGAEDRLAHFAPIDVVIEYLPDFECKRTAGMIAVPLGGGEMESDCA